MESKAIQLDSLRKLAETCTKCGLCETRTKVVFGEGPINARLMIIGEGPGENEDKKGKPFVGKSGKELDKWLNRLELSRNDTYITNIVKCRPPANRDPKIEESYRCTAFYLFEQVRLVNPAVICTLGRPATQIILASDLPMTAMINKEYEFFNRPLIPLFHPAYILRNPPARRIVYQGLDFLKEYL